MVKLHPINPKSNTKAMNPSHNPAKTNKCGKFEIKSYLCTIILKGCLALGSKTNCFYQTERQAEIKPIGVVVLSIEFKVLSF
jgi:hypothetical protein